MKYMLLLFDPKSATELTPAEQAEWRAFGEGPARAATQVSAEALHAAATATVVSERNGRRVITDGPFVETKEQLGGFYVFDCENLEAALEIAAQTPTARSGHVEIRPVIEFS
jgi:hypothetical protein